MTLSKHVDTSALTSKILKHTQKLPLNNHEEYISKYNSNETIPKYKIPETSTNGDLVYDLIHNDLTLDGNPTLNLASFVNTNIDDTALKLISENVVKNLADNDEYPSLIEFQKRCVSILSDLWHAPKTPNTDDDDACTTAIGTATTGSSEAIMLGGLAMKKKWQETRSKQGQDATRPNIIMASCVQVALEKFARYFDVENRLVNINAASNHLIDVSKIEENVDENTIGIFVILGSTFTGSFEPVLEISELLDDIQSRKGFNVPIHVDGASGAFFAPFTYPNLKWDFQIDRVVSINTSGHKFGLTTAGLGWIIWRNVEFLPESLRFKLDYLGGVEETYTLNFSRPGFPVIIQYFNFLKLGREGYTKIFNSCLNNARLLSNFLDDSKYFECVSNIHKKVDVNLLTKLSSNSNNEQYNAGLPVVAFRIAPHISQSYPEIPQAIISSFLRNKGFIIPNYKLPPNESEIQILRVVVRDSMSLDLLDKLMTNLVETMELLIRSVETVRSIQKKQYTKALHHDTTEDTVEDKDEIHGLLLSIASAGLEDVKIEKTIRHEKNRKHHDSSSHGKSYRGSC